MLFTRCPECDTTFRVTDETLKKANGQVRCGRCASVFNAYAELHDPGATSFEAEPAKRSAPDLPPAAPPPTAPEATAPQATTQPVSPAATVSSGTDTGSQKSAEAAAPSIDASSVAEVVAEAELAAEEATREPIDAPSPSQPISATEVDRVLASENAAPLARSVYGWDRPGEHRPSGPRSRWWAIAAAVALLALGAQTIHHFRSDIAGHPTLGPRLVATYAALGVEVTPHWDVQQYEIIDWVATAEPNSSGRGSLKITARIQNRGPLRQPYPAVQLRLKDRWEAAVGSRMFTPAEYLPGDAPRERLMSPGETARAEIEVVDPGPDAYGFELDVCIEVEASLVTCGSDEVFL